MKPYLHGGHQVAVPHDTVVSLPLQNFSCSQSIQQKCTFSLMFLKDTAKCHLCVCAHVCVHVRVTMCNLWAFPCTQLQFTVLFTWCQNPHPPSPLFITFFLFEKNEKNWQCGRAWVQYRAWTYLGTREYFLKKHVGRWFQWGKYWSLLVKTVPTFWCACPYHRANRKSREKVSPQRKYPLRFFIVVLWWAALISSKLEKAGYKYFQQIIKPPIWVTRKNQYLMGKYTIINVQNIPNRRRATI